MNYDFEWDPKKAKANWPKHGVYFEQAATVFRDPHAISVYDDAHSKVEDRWVTMGVSATGGLLVVHHTYEEVNANTVRIRIFSSRRATRKETAQYREGAR